VKDIGAWPEWYWFKRAWAALALAVGGVAAMKLISLITGWCP